MQALLVTLCIAEGEELRVAPMCIPDPMCLANRTPVLFGA
jgi:hypothetical protein